MASRKWGGGESRDDDELDMELNGRIVGVGALCDEGDGLDANSVCGAVKMKKR